MKGKTYATLLAVVAGLQASCAPNGGTLGRNAQYQSTPSSGGAGAPRQTVRPAAERTTPPAVLAAAPAPTETEAEETAEKASENPTQAQALKPLRPSAVSPCPCEDCKCPDPLVCKNNHCCAEYAIQFTASWCAPCKRMIPVVHELRAKGFPVYYFDIEEYPEASRGIRAVPTTVFYREGEVRARLTGIVSAREIQELFEDE